MKRTLCFLLLLNTYHLLAQNTALTPCSSPEASQFDFWVGEWNLTWNDSLHGTNSIEKKWGNCSVHEQFSDQRSGYFGESWTVYNANYKQWQQTWIDNNGGYIHLTGGMSGDSMILVTQERNVPASLSPSGKLVNRMVYYNITPGSLDWSWEASTDGGRTWTPKWQIHYTRKNK